METMTEEYGFALCDSSALRAVACRRLGSLPLCLPFHMADVGEAKLADGRRVLVTWGAGVGKDSQFWHAHNTRFQPIWLGADDGTCELVIGDVHDNFDEIEWLWAGLRITKVDGPAWREVKGGE